MAKPKKIKLPAEENLETDAQKEQAYLTRKDFERIILFVKLMQLGHCPENELNIEHIRSKAKFITDSIFNEDNS